MLLIGLTGGIASGKSTVAARFAAEGVAIIDADVLAREVVAGGTEGFDAVVERFGEQVVGADGQLDRPALGRTVFGDEAARRDLEGIIHPRVRAATLERIAELDAAGADAVVHDVPLLVEAGLADSYPVIVVVAASEEHQVERLVRDRGMDPDDARARIASQAPLADKLAVATHVIRNDGTRAELEAAADAVVTELLARARSEA